MRKGSAQEIIRKEHIAETEAKRVQLVDPFGGILTDGNFTIKIDNADANTTYIGKAQIGSTTSSATWQIKKVSVFGSVTTISWSNGTDAFTSAWDNRASYSYS